MKDNQITKSQLDSFGVLLQALNNITKRHNSNVIFFTYPIQTDSSINDAYTKLLNSYNFIYIDLSKYKEIEDTTGVPVYGFLNSKLGFGHLSNYGHQVYANILGKNLLPILSNRTYVDSFSKFQPK